MLKSVYSIFKIYMSNFAFAKANNLQQPVNFTESNN